MKSTIWHLLGIGLLCSSLPVLAEEQGGSPLQSRPDEVHQTQDPRTGYYQDIPRRYESHGRQDHGYMPPPYGARVKRLPRNAREVWVGNVLFFQAAGTFYQYLEHSREYVVVHPPVQARGGYDVIAYPATGQYPEQVDRDHYECHRWAVQRTGFDPAKARYAPAAQVADSYRRALGACLSGRGYTVN
ncbi:glycine zipper family protein [Pseudomonas tussilaginis]|uniref:DUF6515 family protein n=1 Tax=unclassified Pseudomonas TaxID=196821 RepID=UPI000C6DDF5F|nr:MULTISPECIES: DUF6515 family protein [unclassified Pseudomonas]QYX47034.1 glycine zipper family protein [Pseudomonas sp. S11A 273]